MSVSPSASEYIQDNFEPSDRVAVLLRNPHRDEVIQRIGTADTVAGRDFQEWLQSKNQSGFDIYIGMNALREGACSRTKQDIQTIRHVYLDIDYEGEMALAAIQKSDEVPKPNYVLNTSPGKYQVIWKMEGASPEEAESLQQAMAEQFGTDPAATDSTRVLRLPGFVNRKYEEEFHVEAEVHATTVYHLQDFKIDAEPTDSGRHVDQTLRSPRPDGAPITQSERDWAYAKRALTRGDNPDVVTQRIADFRADEKHNPEYYARLTVTKALAEIQKAKSGSEGPRPSGNPAPPSIEIEQEH
ncbi:MAG: DNA-primase RepB domain-containing protein [Candidatus Acidiferrales bacterium]